MDLSANPDSMEEKTKVMLQIVKFDSMLDTVLEFSETTEQCSKADLIDALCPVLFGKTTRDVMKIFVQLVIDVKEAGTDVEKIKQLTEAVDKRMQELRDGSDVPN